MSTLTTAQGDELAAAFDAWRGKMQVLSQADLKAFVQQFRVESSPEWACTIDNVASTLERHGALSAVEIPSEGDYRPFHRYVTPQATAFDVAARLRPKGYFSHATAVFAHGLTEQIPQTIYINHEQSKKPGPTGNLAQAGLDRAFKSRQRVSKFAFVYGRNRIVILNGKQTGSLGVKKMSLEGSELSVTDLERTLIDIAVRPVYGGGVYEILAAYRAAVDRVEIGRIVEHLDALEHMYPYHQAIGFYLQRAGASAASTAPLRELGLDFDFYLVHGLKAPVLDPSWRIYVPDGL
jgi:predicted transcriptional regulator of viral defense system